MFPKCILPVLQYYFFVSYVDYEEARLLGSYATVWIGSGIRSEDLTLTDVISWAAGTSAGRRAAPSTLGRSRHDDDNVPQSESDLNRISKL